MGVVVVLTLEEEGLVWWPEEGESQSHPLVVDREWEEGKVEQFLMRHWASIRTRYFPALNWTQEEIS